MSEAVTLYMTGPDAPAATTLARQLLNQRLIACANIMPAVTSLYRWQGAIEQADEVAIVMKTVAAHLPAIKSWVRHHHPYDTACLVAWPIVDGEPAYLDWIAAETAPDKAVI